MLRTLLWIPLWLIGLMLLVSGLALSPWGTDVLLEQGQSRGWLTYESAEGAPLDALRIDGLHLTAGQVEVRLDSLSLVWADDCLLSGRLCIDDLSLDGLRLDLHGSATTEEAPSSAGDEDAEPLSLDLPFPIELRRLSLTDIEITLADGTRLGWKSFHSGAVAEADRLTLSPTTLMSPFLALPASPGNVLALAGDAEPHDDRIVASAIDASLAAQSPLPATAEETLSDTETVPLDERKALELPAIRLPIAIEAPDLQVEDFQLTGPTDYQVPHLALAVSGEGHRVHIEPLEIETRDADIELRADITLRDDYPLDAELLAELYLPDMFPQLSGERLSLTLGGSLADLDASVSAEGPATLQADGTLNVLNPTLPFSLALQAQALRWPLGEQAATDDATIYRLEDLNLQVAGDLQGYRTELSVMASGTQLPRTRLDMTGDGNLGRFEWSPLSLTTERGSLESQGTISWTEGLDVGASIQLDDLDPGQFSDAIDDSRISGESRIEFTQDAEGWRIDVPELALDGQLQSLPFALDARLAGNDAMHWQVERLDLRQGDNRLTAQGELAEHLDFVGTLDAPRLGTISDQLGGRVRGDIVIGGTLASPQLELDVRGEALHFAANRLDDLSVVAEVNGIDDPRMDMTLEASGIEAGNQRVETLVLGLTGRLSDHRLTLNAQANDSMPLTRAELALTGGMNNDRTRYQGRLDPLSIDTQQGDIRLAEAIDFTANLDAGNLLVQPFCLRRESGGRLCLSERLDASANAGRAVVALHELPMDLISATLPDDWTVDGETQGEVTVVWQQGGADWSLDAAIDSRLSLQGVDAYGQPWELPESRLSLTSDATPAQAELGLEASLAEAGDMTLTLNIDQPLEAGDLSGTLSLEGIRLAPYRAFVTGVDVFEGDIGGEVDIAGTLDNPDLDGTLQMTGLRASGGELPLDLHDGELTIELMGNRGSIDGFIAAQEGRLTLDGNARWPSRESWQASLTVDGRDEPLLIDMPEFGRLRIAPDLSIDTAPSHLRIRGRVEVPWARLEVGQIPPSATSPSPDEVIISEREDRAAEQARRSDDDTGGDTATSEALANAGMPLDMQIDLALGPDMQLDAYGLESGLQGNLEVRQGRGPLQLFGDVNLVDGRFSAFGQELLIRRGEILFSGPTDQPLLDFEAIRDPEVTEDGVIAGLRVTGPASSPQLTVFSEPAMDETRALSYLLRGRAPEDGDADGALTSALIGLSLSRTGSTVGQIGEVFGVDELALDTAGAGDDSQVVVSGYVFDDLKVSYGVGIFSPIAELTLRYTLWQNLYLEAVSGAAQAVDLVYRFSLGNTANAP
ncbi:autotransporter assembly complex protein TamB [Aidingimonas lacisalsi]|uniref:autotransporter assembly complex protein TamB n=1 Tax=Aidingimonas lacisalsi TaxID=2604086 RepID=UPI0011D21677|nr:translocation/assembly module TamB domain-containing protein [Aidingimonas lacisalsi]